MADKESLTALSVPFDRFVEALRNLCAGIQADTDCVPWSKPLGRVLVEDDQLNEPAILLRDTRGR